MEDVRFYDFEFNLLHVEHDVISCNWMLYENQAGNFEMHVPIDSAIVRIIMENRYIVVVQGTKQAIVTSRMLGKEAVFYGRTCNWILSRFCVTESFNTDDLYEKRKLSSRDISEICRYLMSQSMSHIHNFIFENCEDAFGEVLLEQVGVTSVLESIESCTKQVRCGYEVFFDVKNKQWILRLFKGKLLPFVLSEDDRNCYDIEYFEDLQNYFSGGFYQKELEDGESVLTILPSSLEGIYAWQTDLNGRTEQEARTDLKNYCIKNRTAAKTCGLQYGRDYGLNDTVQLRKREGEFVVKGMQRFVGVHLWYEGSDVGEQPILENVEV